MKIKEKSNMITKAIVFQIAMSIFGIMLASSIQSFGNAVKLFAGIFSVLFYFALIGAALNEDGLKDNIKVSRNTVKADAFLGMKYIAVSYIPTFAVTILYIILRLFGIANGLTSTLNVLIRLFLSGMYLSLDSYLFAAGNTPMPVSINGWTFLIYQIFSVIVCGLFYIAGLKGINLLSSKKEEK